MQGFLHPYEKAYLDLVKKCLETGQLNQNERTGTGTLSLFAERLEFDLSEQRIPLLLTKKMNFKSILNELLWFISGSTDTKDLKSKIWDKNAFPDGTLGPIYGHQWRKLAKKDQLQEALDLIKNDPQSRRILVSAWNVEQLDQMALPPCHVLFQFYVNSEKKTLSCQMYQRSADLGLGVPFNIASYAILTHIMAHLSGYLKAEKLVVIFGDTHVYLNHIDALKEQLERQIQEERPFPRIQISPRVTSLNDIQENDIELLNYENPLGILKMEMSK